MKIIKRIKAALRFRKAVEMAEQRYRQTGLRQYIIPSSDKGKKLIVIDRPNFRLLKRKGYITRNAVIKDLERECFYMTPNLRGDKLSAEELDFKRRQYIIWAIK